MGMALQSLKVTLYWNFIRKIANCDRVLWTKHYTPIARNTSNTTVVSPQNLHCVDQRKILLLKRRKCPHTDKNLPCTDTGGRGPISGRSGRNPTSHGVGDPVLFREWTHLN